MQIQPPKLAFYDCTFEEATDAVCKRGLRHCDPQPGLVSAYQFTNHSDLSAFRLGFGCEIAALDSFALVPAHKRAEANRLVRQLSMSTRVARLDLLSVYLWDTDDEFTFNQEVGQPVYS